MQLTFLFALLPLLAGVAQAGSQPGLDIRVVKDNSKRGNDDALARRAGESVVNSYVQCEQVCVSPYHSTEALRLLTICLRLLETFVCASQTASLFRSFGYPRHWNSCPNFGPVGTKLSDISGCDNFHSCRYPGGCDLDQSFYQRRRSSNRQLQCGHLERRRATDVERTQHVPSQVWYVNPACNGTIASLESLTGTQSSQAPRH